MKTNLSILVGALIMTVNASGADSQEKRTIRVTLTMPSAAHQVKIKEVYQTPRELWVLSEVTGGEIGAAVITKRSDEVRVEAPELPVKYFVLGKDWNWKEEDYIFLKNREEFDKYVSQAKAKKIFERKQQAAMNRYIIMFRKNIFRNGKTKDGQTLEQLARKHSKEFGGKFGRVLEIINGFTVELTPENAKRLQRLPEVRSVERDQQIGIR